MRRALGFLVGCSGIFLLLAGYSMSSNMAFRLELIVGPDENFNLSLPWNNDYVDAADLLNDLSGIPHDPTIAESVSRVQNKFSSFSEFILSTWVYGGSPSGNFAIEKGQAYIIKTGSSGVSNFIVGSHDPNQLITLEPNRSLNLAVPPHGVHERVADLMNDLSGVPHNSAIVNRISRFLPNGALATWAYASNPVSNFPLIPGEGVILQTGSSGLSNYAYPHY